MLVAKDALVSDHESVCIYCKQLKITFTKEHIIPVTFGGTDEFLKDLVCSDCNRTFGEKFEGRFLKGPGIESLIRSVKGQQGRHGIPVFGDGSYGNWLYINVREQVPPIKISLSNTGLHAPIQIISVSRDGQFFHAVYEEDKFKGSLFSLIDYLWKKNPDSSTTTHAYLWIRDIDVSVANYRAVRKEFFKYLGILGIDGDFLCESIKRFAYKADLGDLRETAHVFKNLPQYIVHAIP